MSEDGQIGHEDEDQRAASDPLATGQTKVAIACQGGGSHTAFTAGVLRELLAEWDPQYELVGISGTSGGAFNALAVWYGLVTGDAEKAIDTLDGLWTDIATSKPGERLLNRWLKTYTRIESSGFPTPQLSPYDLPWSDTGKRKIEQMLNRHIDFASIPDLCERDVPELVVGTVNVNEGIFETFTNADVTPAAVLASAAVPNLFEAVELHGHAHWDGLFSQNPPVDDLLTVDSERKPDELWVIQINPQRSPEIPQSVEEIADRRNELSGNISLNQELRFVERVNEWIEAGYLPDSKFSKTTIRKIEMPDGYQYTTKLDRSPAFIDELRTLGAAHARRFLAGEA